MRTGRVPSGAARTGARARTGRAAGTRAGAGRRAAAAVVAAGAIIATVAVVRAAVAAAANVAVATAPTGCGAVAGPVAGLAAAEALVVAVTASATATRALGELYDHAAAEEAHAVAVLDGILGITDILVLDKTVSYKVSARGWLYRAHTSLDVATNNAAVLDKDVLELADASILGDSADEKSHSCL